MTLSNPNKIIEKDLVVIGGGAAGFFCAINAAQLGNVKRIIILEKTKNVLSKVKVSGGGRCNVTNTCTDISELIKNYPRGTNFLKKAFHWFNTTHTHEWFLTRGVALMAEKDGRVFPKTNNSQTIIDLFLKETNRYNIEIRTNCEVININQNNGIFEVITGNNLTLKTANICVTSGGLQKNSRANFLEHFELEIEPSIPSLFTFNIPNSKIKELMGISVPKATIKIIGTKFQQTGPILITHWGFSGPAVLKLSAFAAKELFKVEYHFSILINWLNNTTENSLRELISNCRQQFSNNKIYQKNPFDLPTRLWHFLLAESNILPEENWGNLTAQKQNKLIQLLVASKFEVKGKTTFKEEFVTCGGINLNEIDVNTMQSKKYPGLYFAGEILDIDGITGGFNFQNAWTTAFIAAKSIAAKV